MDTTVRPLLILTSCSFLIPITKVVTTNYHVVQFYASLSQICMFMASITFHSTRSEYALFRDRIAMTNLALLGMIVVHNQSAREIVVYWGCMVYILFSYILGQNYNLYAFDKNFYLQQFWHALIHIFMSYLCCVSIDYTLENTN